jgi:hypothetical protein
MINFAEIKLKLTVLDVEHENITFGFAFLNSKKPPQYTDVIEWKHTKDAKIISELLETIEQAIIQRDDAIRGRFDKSPKCEKAFFAKELAEIMDDGIKSKLNQLTKGE